MNSDPGLRQMKAEQWFISKLRAIAPEKAVRVFSGTTDISIRAKRAAALIASEGLTDTVCGKTAGQPVTFAQAHERLYGRTMNKVLFGDCRDTMRNLISDGVRVQTCVTSPPYFGLRDYGHPGQLGHEKTPAEFVAALVEVFGLVRELLADDGVLWLNLGDSYAGTGKSGGGAQGARWKECGMDTEGPRGGKWMPPPPGLKPKDLIGIPWRVAFALQADGWYLRQDIIWHKPNPMPESVTDRCTKAHEYLFLLAKSERYYFYHEAIKEPVSVGAKKFNGSPAYKASLGRIFAGRDQSSAETRNKRSVWTVPSAPYNGAHFATFPPALIEPCILAGSRIGDTVLDPFFGSGTTGQVSQALGRQWIGCELNPDYASLQQERTSQPSLVLPGPTQCEADHA